MTEEELKALEQAATNVLTGKADAMAADWMPDILKLIRAYRGESHDGRCTEGRG